MTSGFVFGKLAGKYVAKKEDMDGHILVVGGSGSGKSSCLAIPSLRAWNSRVFAVDIKGELYENTRHIRRNVKVFDPQSAATYGYDPFYPLAETDNQAQEAEAISIALIPTSPEVKDPFWLESARNMFSGLILHFYNLGFSFVDTVKTILSSNIGKLIDDIFDNSQTAEAKYYLSTFVYMENKTLVGIYAELSRHIMIFATDKSIISCFSKNEKICPDDLEHNSDIYICIPEHLLKQWKNLLTLMVSQFLRHFEKRPDMTATPILFLLDEFPRLGRIEGITDAFATLRAKKITICSIIQSLAQLDMIYGEATRRVIVDNCQYKALLSATDAESQEYFSKLIGTREKLKTSTNRQYEPITSFPAGSGIHWTTEEKRATKPEELATLTNKYVLYSPFGSFKVEKMPYYI